MCYKYKGLWWDEGTGGGMWYLADLLTEYGAEGWRVVHLERSSLGYNVLLECVVPDQPESKGIAPGGPWTPDDDGLR